jgi:hypothetical protein
LESSRSMGEKEMVGGDIKRVIEDETEQSMAYHEMKGHESRKVVY